MTGLDDPSRTGQQFGPYRIGPLLGRGGMGEVFRAVHVKTDQEVAVKFITKEGYGDPINRKRFLREIKACMTLSHPNVVRTLDWGEQGPDIWYAMEFVGGRTLADLLEEHPRLDLTRSLSIARDLLSALAAMHPVGYIHRDIKPANIMITPEGRTVLMDFGLVKISGDETFTVVGKVLGTPRYMPPEMIAGRVCDERGDLYQVAFIAHECVSGNQAFPSTDYLAFLKGDLSPLPTPVRQFVPSLPASLDVWLAGGLAPDPANRYASASDMLADLQVLESGGVVEPYARRAHRSRTSLVVENELTALFGDLAPVASDPWGTVVEAREGQQPVWIRVIPPRLLLGTDQAALVRDLQSLAGLGTTGLLLPTKVVPVGQGLLMLMPAGPRRRLSEQTTPLAPGQAASVVLECLRALAGLHATGAGHGFIDPRSVLMGGLGGLTIADVEAHVIVRHTDCLAAKDSSLRMSLLTAPEVLDGQAPTPASDLYSLGRLLLRLVTGQSQLTSDVTMRLPAPMADLVDAVVRPLGERQVDPAAFAAALGPLASSKPTAPGQRRPTGKVPVRGLGEQTPRGGQALPPRAATSTFTGGTALALVGAALLVGWLAWGRLRGGGQAGAGAAAIAPAAVRVTEGVDSATIEFPSDTAFAASVEYGPGTTPMSGVRESSPRVAHRLVLSGLSPGTRYLWRFVDAGGEKGPRHSFVTRTIGVKVVRDEHRLSSIRLEIRTSMPIVARAVVPASGGRPAVTLDDAGGVAREDHSFDIPCAVEGAGAEVDLCAAGGAGSAAVLRHLSLAGVDERALTAQKTVNLAWVSGVVEALCAQRRRRAALAASQRFIEEAVASRQEAIGQLEVLARPALESPTLSLTTKSRLYDLLSLLSKLDAACQALDVRFATGASTGRPATFTLYKTPPVAHEVPDVRLKLPFSTPEVAFIPYSTPKVEDVEEVFTTSHAKRSDKVTFDVESPESVRSAAIFLPIRYLDESTFKDNALDVLVNDRLKLLFRYDQTDYRARSDPHQPMPGLFHSFDPRYLKASGNEILVRVTPLPGIGNTMGMTTIPYVEVWMERR